MRCNEDEEMPILRAKAGKVICPRRCRRYLPSCFCIVAGMAAVCGEAISTCGKYCVMGVDAHLAREQNRQDYAKERHPMKQKILQVIVAVFACACITAQATTVVLNSTNQFNYFDDAWYTGPEVRYSNSVPGIFESSTSGVLIHSSRSRGDGSMITKQPYFLAGGTAQFIWSGSGGSSFMQCVCGMMT